MSHNSSTRPVSQAFNVLFSASASAADGVEASVLCAIIPADHGVSERCGMVVFGADGQILLRDVINSLWEIERHPNSPCSVTFYVDCIDGCGPHPFSLLFSDNHAGEAFSSWFEEGLNLADASYEYKRAKLQDIVAACA